MKHHKHPPRPSTKLTCLPASVVLTQSSPKPMSIKSVMPSSHLILCRPLLLLPPIPPIENFQGDS